MQEVTMPRLRHARFRFLPALSLALVLAALGCGEDAQAPTPPALDPALAIRPANGLSFRQVSVGFGHSCGVTQAHLAYCWGVNFAGQLGDGTTTDRLTPVPVAGGLRFRQVSAGARHVCGVTLGNVAYCWGANLSGALGDGTTTERLTPVAVAGGLRFGEVSASGNGDHTCGVTTGNRAYCWGANFNAQLGDGTSDNFRPVPVAVAGGLRFRQVSTGGIHSCGVVTDNRAYCWGTNFFGQFGNGMIDNGPQVVFTPTPVAVAGGLRFHQVDAATLHTCGLTTGNLAYCWGENEFGLLGDGTTTDRLTPVAVAGGLRFRQVSGGENFHTCGVATGNRAYCWGSNFTGELGDGTTTARLTPVAVAGGLQFTEVSAGTNHTCGVTTGNVAYCWGLNNFGQLGDSTRDTRLAPVAVAAPGP
jgi:alpha-tubulin suppressor-like RCC1 family protein